MTEMLPTELRLTLAPRNRIEAIDVNARIAREAGDILRRHRRALYCSLYTAAGALEQSLSSRTGTTSRRCRISSARRRRLLPGAEYRHDQMELRRS